MQCNQFLTKTFLLRSKHQLSNNASILAKSASITGEAGTGEPGDSTGDRDDDDDNPCSASVVLATGVIVLVSTKYTKIYHKHRCQGDNIHVHVTYFDFPHSSDL